MMPVRHPPHRAAADRRHRHLANSARNRTRRGGRAEIPRRLCFNGFRSMPHTCRPEHRFNTEMAHAAEPRRRRRAKRRRHGLRCRARCGAERGRLCRYGGAAANGTAGWRTTDDTPDALRCAGERTMINNATLCADRTVPSGARIRRVISGADAAGWRCQRRTLSATRPQRGSGSGRRTTVRRSSALAAHVRPAINGGLMTLSGNPTAARPRGDGICSRGNRRQPQYGANPAGRATAIRSALGAGSRTSSERRSSQRSPA